MGALLEPTNLLLLACALLYGLIGEGPEALVLLVFVGAISALDAWQQRRSNRALAELARLSAPLAHVRRQGVDLELPAEQVRLGDRLRLEEGDRVAADARLQEAVGLWLDESLLSGESLPVARQPGELVRAGSLVAGGRGWAVVEAIAEATELGRLGLSLGRLQPPPTRLQRQTRRLTARLTLLALGLCAGLAVLRGGLSGDWPGALIAALALALAVLPNEIPVVLALFLALGAVRLGRQGVLARRPAAVESLGSTTVLAVDKTGTLTQNRMAVQRLRCWPEGATWNPALPLEEPWHRLLEMAVLASRGDPVDAMEQAIQRLAEAELGGSEHLHPDWPLEHEYPLQSDLLVFSRLWRDAGGERQLAAKGAPEAIADLCHLPAPEAAALLASADGLAAQGLRVLAVAAGLNGAPRHRPSGAEEPPADVHDFRFQPVGLIGLADPLRPEVPAAIAAAQRAGVRVVMLTGDGPITARSIADQAGLPPGPVVAGSELEPLEPAALVRRIAGVSVFARVLPQQKLALVQALQAAGEVVAMTGDGVNDAPALRAADIGVAMGRRGTAVAREAADLVLLGDSFSDLVAALQLGRRVYANLQGALGYTLAVHLPIVVLGLLPLLSPAQPLLLMPVHIALLHLVIDPACTVVFEAQPAGPELLAQPPRPPEAPLIRGCTWRLALLQGLVLTLASLALAFWPGLAEPVRRTLVVSLLLLAGGGLVGLNLRRGGQRRPGVDALLGPMLGLGLWVVLLALARVAPWLAMAPLRPHQLLALAALAPLTLLGAAAASRVAGPACADRRPPGSPAAPAASNPGTSPGSASC